MFDRLTHGFARRIVAWADGIEAGRSDRRLAGWLPSRQHINSLVHGSGATTLARARYLVRNNAYALNAVECFASNVVGVGIMPRWLPPSRDGANSDLKKAGQQLWIDWTDEADAEGLTDFYGLMRRAAREVFIAGEVFIRFRPRYLRDGLTVPLQLQMLPSEMLDVNFTQDLDNGNRVRQGIEFDAIGRRVAYHFFRVHPGDSTERPSYGEPHTRVPAGDVLHILDPIESGQIRGLTRLTAAIVALWTLDGYDDAEVERKKTAALFSIFITQQAATEGKSFVAALSEAQKAANPGAGKDAPPPVNLQPGSVHELRPGEEVKVAAPADVGQSYEAFQYRTLARICAALGLPYAGVTGDLTAANYANQRAALVEARRRLQAVQYGVFVFLMCRPVWNRFLDAAVLADKLVLPGYADNPRPYRKVRWIAPRWEWVDPLKDRQAEVIALNARTKSISQAIEEEGNDPDEVMEQIAKDQARMRELGITPATAQSEAPLPNGGIVDKPPAKNGAGCSPALQLAEQRIERGQ